MGVLSDRTSATATEGSLHYAQRSTGRTEAPYWTRSSFAGMSPPIGVGSWPVGHGLAVVFPAILSIRQLENGFAVPDAS